MSLALGVPSLIQLIISIVALYYGITNLDQSCTDSFVHLAVWMIVQGAVMLFVTIGWVPSLFCGPPGIFMYAVVAGLYGLFNIIWSIIGGVILWRDSLPCHDLDPAFYVASMVVVIVSLILGCCTLCCSSGSAKEESDF